MWRIKKFILIAVLAAVVLAGSIGGIVLAADNGDASQPGAKYGALLDRVFEIYEQKTGVAIDQEALKDAFAQARSEMQAAAMAARLAKMVENGVIDETQAEELQEWWQSRPDDVPFGPGLRGPGGFRGMGGMRGFGGPCAPIE